MRTAIIILGGFFLLGACLLAGRMVGGNATMVNAAKVFIVIWMIAAGVNMWVGVAKAGYSVSVELPIFALIFAVPAAAAVLVRWKFL